MGFRRRVREEPAERLFANKRFGPYSPVQESALREAGMQESRALARMHRLMRRIMRRKAVGDAEAEAAGLWMRAHYCAADIEAFSLALDKYERGMLFATKAGHFLSGLAGGCPEEAFIIHTLHLDILPGALGRRNTKRVDVIGPVGDYAAESMTGGLLEVHGDAGMRAGWLMLGGRLVIHGSAGKGLAFTLRRGGIIVKEDAGDEAGASMESGSIAIGRNAGDYLGQGMAGGEISVARDAGDMAGIGMKGGIIRIAGNSGAELGKGMAGREIHVGGEIESVSDSILGGRIYHKGRLIVDK